MIVGPASYSLWLSAVPACPPPAPAVAPCPPIPADTTNPDYLLRRPYWQHLEIENVRRPGAIVFASGATGRLIDLLA